MKKIKRILCAIGKTIIDILGVIGLLGIVVLVFILIGLVIANSIGYYSIDGNYLNGLWMLGFFSTLLFMAVIGIPTLMAVEHYQESC